MKTTLTRMSTMGALLIIAACGSNKNSPNSPIGTALDGKVTISTKINALTSTGLLGAEVCATFSAQPYSISSTTSAMTNVGNPATFTSTSAAANGNAGAGGGTDTILSCSDGLPDAVTGSPTLGDNFGYLVNASNFYPCSYANFAAASAAAAAGTDPLAAALLQVSPVTVNEPFLCSASNDYDLNINVPIDVPLTAQAGYVDISAGVDVTGVYVGCKNADIDPQDGNLHFGQTYYDPSGSISDVHPSRTWFNNDSSTDSAQFSSSIYDSAGGVDFATTGIVDPTTTLLYQTFLPTSLDQPTSTATPSCNVLSNTYYAVNQPECITESTGGESPTVSTTADLANAYVEGWFNPGGSAFYGFATASIRLDGSGNPYVDILWSAPSYPDTQPLTLDPGATPTSTTGESISTGPAPTTLGGGLNEIEVSATTSGAHFTYPAGATPIAVYPDFTNGEGIVVPPGQTTMSFNVIVQGTGGVDNLEEIWYNGTTWVVWFNDNMPTSSQAACLGLYASGSFCQPNNASTCGYN